MSGETAVKKKIGIHGDRLWGLKEWITTCKLKPFKDMLEKMTFEDILALNNTTINKRRMKPLGRLMKGINDQKFKQSTIKEIIQVQLNTSDEVIDCVYKLYLCLYPVHVMLGPLNVLFTKAAEKVMEKLEIIQPQGIYQDCKTKFYNICVLVEDNPTFHEGEKQKFRAWIDKIKSVDSA